MIGKKKVFYVLIISLIVVGLYFVNFGIGTNIRIPFVFNEGDSFQFQDCSSHSLMFTVYNGGLSGNGTFVPVNFGGSLVLEVDGDCTVVLSSSVIYSVSVDGVGCYVYPSQSFDLQAGHTYTFIWNLSSYPTARPTVVPLEGVPQIYWLIMVVLTVVGLCVVLFMYFDKSNDKAMALLVVLVIFIIFVVMLFWMGII